MSLRIYRGDPLSLAAEVTLKVDGVVQPTLADVTVEASLLTPAGEEERLNPSLLERVRVME